MSNPLFEGGEVAFRGTRFLDERPQEMAAHDVDFSMWPPGSAILHLGGQYHFARPLTAGVRVNLVIWMFAKHGVVRIAPYEEADQVDAKARWAAFGKEEVQRRLGREDD